MNNHGLPGFFSTTDSPEESKTHRPLIHFMTAAVAAAWLAFAGCGCRGSLCDQATSINDTITANTTDCRPLIPPLFGMGTSFTVPSPDLAACEAKCTDADKEKIQVALDCIEALGECTAGKADEYRGKLNDCALQQQDVSSQCSQAFNLTPPPPPPPPM